MSLCGPYSFKPPYNPYLFPYNNILHSNGIPIVHIKNSGHNHTLQGSVYRISPLRRHSAHGISFFGRSHLHSLCGRRRFPSEARESTKNIWKSQKLSLFSLCRIQSNIHLCQYQLIGLFLCPDIKHTALFIVLLRLCQVVLQEHLQLAPVFF